MIDINADIGKYRECVEFLWNKCCCDAVDDKYDWDSLDLLDDICVSLFSLLILRPYDLSDFRKSNYYDQYPEPVPRVHVSPVAEDDIPILINRDVKSGGYWDYYLNKSIRKPDVDLLFIDFFDFDVQSKRCFEYYRARIISAKHDKTLVGRDALIKVCDANILIEEIDGARHD